MTQQFKFNLQRFAGETFIPDEGTQLLTISGNVLKPLSGSVLSGNTLSFGGSSSSSVPIQQRPFNDCTWEEILAIAQAGKGANYFNIGDCKEITLNGNIGNYLTLDNEKLYVYILHFNYPMNGTAENNIILGGFKTALTNGKDVALCDSAYGTDPIRGTIRFNMDHSSSGSGNNYPNSDNYGGWKGSDLRYDILGATSQAPSQYESHSTNNIGYDATAATLTNPKANTLLAALPSDFRNALRLWSRWIDAKGNSSNVEANIEETIDAVTLLTEFEVQGARSYANDYEKNHQKQMDYYKSGNSKIKYRHDSTSSAVWWWLASPSYYNNAGICCVYTDGSIRSRNTALTYALAPAFKI